MDTIDLQEAIDSGLAWQLEGSIGRAAMAAIDSGHCMLGHVGHFDSYGTYVPSRWEVMPGTKGSPEYAGHTVDRVSGEATVRVVNLDGSAFEMQAPIALVFGRMAADLARRKVAQVTIEGWPS